MRNSKGKPPMEIPHTIFAIRRYRFYGIIYYLIYSQIKQNNNISTTIYYVYIYIYLFIFQKYINKFQNIN